MLLHKTLTTLIFFALYNAATAQLVIDKKTIAKSGENFAINLAKAWKYGKIRDFTEEIDDSYAAIALLQQQVLDDLKQAETVSDLHWADLSKSVYLATELIRGATQPGLEINYVIEHPLFQRSPDDTYHDLFIAGGADALPADLSSLQQSKRTSRALSGSFQQLAAERKAYGAVAFQYLAEDLILKATEMNEVLKQSSRFSMTEAERMRLQTFSEDYLLLASQMLERSDALLLDITSVKPLQQQADQQQRQLERTTIARTRVLDY
jgi:hypothetical protein